MHFYVKLKVFFNYLCVTCVTSFVMVAYPCYCMLVFVLVPFNILVDVLLRPPLHYPTPVPP